MEYLKITGIIQKGQLQEIACFFYTIPDIDKCLKNSNEKCDENKICKQVNGTVVCLPGMDLLFRIEDAGIS